MILEPSSVCRLRDLNRVQSDILKIMYGYIKNKPQDDQWRQFEEVIFYDGRRFKVSMTYRLNPFFLEIQKRNIEEE